MRLSKENVWLWEREKKSCEDKSGENRECTNNGICFIDKKTALLKPAQISYKCMSQNEKRSTSGNADFLFYQFISDISEKQINTMSIKYSNNKTN
jgi:hypothetical protein